MINLCAFQVDPPVPLSLWLDMIGSKSGKIIRSIIEEMNMKEPRKYSGTSCGNMLLYCFPSWLIRFFYS